MTLRIALALNLLCALVSAARPAQAQDAPLSPASLKAALQTNPTGADAGKLADRVRVWFGADRLAKGPNPKAEGLDVAWAVEIPNAQAPPELTVETGFTTLGNLLHPDSEIPITKSVFPFTRLGDTDVYTVALTRPEGDVFRWRYDVSGKSVSGQMEVYAIRPDSVANPNVPHGTLTQQPKWKSNIFAGTERNWWIYVPAQYKPENPACVMVFQDGGGYTGFVPTVFDNLIAKGDMPITVGIFINPGNFAADGRSDRSFEYDTLSDQYARFLLEEILPEVEKTAKLRHDPQSRAIAGSSSGGICAFTVAWERPNEFSKVLSWVGSFTNIANGPDFKQGGHNYEAMVRKAPKRPIRVFLQDGENDLDNANGNWPLANQTLAKSLAFAGYDYKFVYGHGFHSASHGRAILPDSLRWLWRDYKPQ